MVRETHPANQCATHLEEKEEDKTGEISDKERHDQRAVERSFMAGECVVAMNFNRQPKCVGAMIENRMGQLNFALRLRYIRMWKRNPGTFARETTDRVD